MFALLCLFQFVSTKPRDWLGRTSVKCPVLCLVGRETSALSMNQFTNPSPSSSLTVVVMISSSGWTFLSQVVFSAIVCASYHYLLTFTFHIYVFVS